MAISTENLNGETVNVNTFKVLCWALKAHVREQLSCWHELGPHDGDFPRSPSVAVELVASFLRDWMFHPVREFNFWQAVLEQQIEYDW